MTQTHGNIKGLITNPDLIIELAKALKSEQEAHMETIELLEEACALLDETMSYFTIRRVAKLNGLPWRHFNTRRLANASEFLGYEVRDAFDANYGETPSFHIDVWRNEYPECDYGEDDALWLEN